jgi:5-methylcytosine-specific restriction endonuclease McrA
MKTLSDGKVCRVCGEWKILTEFYDDRRLCKECYKQRFRDRYSANLEDERARSRTYGQTPEGREHARRRNARYYAGWRLPGGGLIERVREIRRRWREKNREKTREWHRRWISKNPDKRAAVKHRRRSRKRGNGGSFTSAEWRAMCAAFDYKCVRCGQEKPLTVDHVVPLSRGGANDITNLQPLCLLCNSIKGVNAIDYRDPGILAWFLDELDREV